MQITKPAQPGEKRQVQSFDIRLSTQNDATIDILFSKNKVGWFTAKEKISLETFLLILLKFSGNKRCSYKYRTWLIFRNNIAMDCSTRRLHY